MHRKLLRPATILLSKQAMLLTPSPRHQPFILPTPLSPRHSRRLCIPSQVMAFLPVENLLPNRAHARRKQNASRTRQRPLPSLPPDRARQYRQAGQPPGKFLPALSLPLQLLPAPTRKVSCHQSILPSPCSLPQAETLPQQSRSRRLEGITARKRSRLQTKRAPRRLPTRKRRIKRRSSRRNPVTRA
jgi:hypothetical protein